MAYAAAASSSLLVGVNALTCVLAGDLVGSGGAGERRL